MSSVDNLFYECMSQNSKYQALLELIQLLLTMSHGQAAVERGFSINKKVEVENLKHESIIAHRLICDHVNKVGGIQNVDLSKELLQSCKASRHKYEIYLQQKREAEKTEAELGKRKKVHDEVTVLKKKKLKLEEEVKDLMNASEKLSDKAEETGKVSFVTQANSLRRTAKDKKMEIEKIDEKIKSAFEY